MTSEPTIQQRVRAFDHVLSWCGQGDSHETFIDLLTDALHWCRRNGLEFEDFLAIAQSHYQTETLNETGVLP